MLFFVRKYFWRPAWVFPGEFEVSVFFLTENEAQGQKRRCRVPFVGYPGPIWGDLWTDYR